MEVIVFFSKDCNPVISKWDYHTNKKNCTIMPPSSLLEMGVMSPSLHIMVMILLLPKSPAECSSIRLLKPLFVLLGKRCP